MLTPWLSNRVYGPQGSAPTQLTPEHEADSKQAPTSLTNGPPFIEMQAEWILSVLKKQVEDELATVEADQKAEQAWRDHCLDLASKTLVERTESWYMGAKYDHGCST